MNKFVFSILLLAITSSVLGQDVHLSQFYTAQLNLNPALGGNYDGDYRLAANYRNQWRVLGDPITTMMVAFDKKIHFYSDEINAGILIIQDQFAGFNLNTSKILLSGNYKKIIRANEVRAGIQFGIVLRSTDLTAQTFPNQWVYLTGEFDPAVDNQEANILESQQFIDLNFGASWSKAFAKIKPTVGISLFHINRPKDTYFGDTSDRLRMRKVLHGEAVIKINSDISIEPKLLIVVGNKAQNLLIGSNVKKQVNHPKIKHIYGGLLYRDGFKRNRDAIIPIVGFNYEKFDIGFSYDINISKLSSNSSLKSTFEISFIYTAPTFSPKNLSIPCDRY